MILMEISYVMAIMEIVMFDIAKMEIRFLMEMVIFGISKIVQMVTFNITKREIRFLMEMVTFNITKREIRFLMVMFGTAYQRYFRWLHSILRRGRLGF